MPNVKTDFFLTPQGRFAWPYLDQPRTVDLFNKPLDDPKYEVVLYLPKTSANRDQDSTFLLLSAKVMEVVGQQFRGVWPQVSQRGEWENWPIDDCDADPAALEKAPWGRGCWKIRLSGGKYPPKVVDSGNNDIQRDVTGKFRPDQFKGGDYGFASINCYGWGPVAGKSGVSFGLEGVKKTADGDAIGGGGRSSSEIFGAPTAQAAAPAPALPPAYAPQPTAFAPQGGSPVYAPPAPAYGGPPGGYAPPAGGPGPAPAQPVYGGAPPAQGYAPPALAPAQPVYGGGMPPAPPFAPPPIGTR